MSRALWALRLVFYPLPLVLIFGIVATTQTLRANRVPAGGIIAIDSLWVFLPAVWICLELRAIHRKVKAGRLPEPPKRNEG